MLLTMTVLGVVYVLIGLAACIFALVYELRPASMREWAQRAALVVCWPLILVLAIGSLDYTGGRHNRTLRVKRRGMKP